MDKLSQLFRRLALFFQRRRLESDLQEEMAHHLQMKIEENLAAGMTPDQARYAARRGFGNLTLIAEHSRSHWGFAWLDTLSQDARYALRTLRHNPAFTLAAVVTLALGIGANTAVFSVIQAVLLRPLPYPSPSRLVRVEETDPKGEWAKSGLSLRGVSPPDFLDFRENSRSFEQLAAWNPASFIVGSGGMPQRIDAVVASSDLFNVLGVGPLMGRSFAAEDELPDRSHVAVISYSLWQQTFGNSPDAVGRTISLDGVSYTVIGVMPPGFAFPASQPEVALWTPVHAERDPKLRGATYLNVIGRLRPGVTLPQAKSDLDRIAAHPSEQFFWSTQITGLKDDMVSPVRSPLLLLAAAVAFVLLIAAANVSSLCLSRAANRQKEIALRLALGATRRRVIRQLLTESVLLSLTGAVAGVLLANWGTRALLAIAPRTLPRIEQVGMDSRVFLFTLGVAVLTGLAFGLGPALHAAGHDVHQVIKQGGTRSRPGRHPLHTAAVVGQLALAAVLLCAAGLMIRTLLKLHQVDLGFDASQVLTASVFLPQNRYPQPAQQSAFLDQVLERVQALPGVDSAGGATGLPMGGTNMVFHLRITHPGQPEVSVIARFSSVTPGFFRALRMPLLQGRWFTAADGNTSQPVAVVNQTLARTLFPGQNPIGKRVANGFTKEAPYVVGVVGDTRQTGFDSQPKPELYVPFAQRPWPFMRFAIRARGDAAALAPALRAQVQSVDAGESVDQIRTLESLLSASLAERRFYMLLLTLFAALALSLSAVGIFGVVSYTVASRTHEIGIRMALGASRANVLRLIVAGGFLPCAGGIVLGILGALAATRLMTKLLFGVTPTDAPTFAALALLLGGVSLLASYLPARRALRVDPMVALRYE